MKTIFFKKESIDTYLKADSRFISFGIILLRKRKNIRNDRFEVPLYPFLSILAGMCSIYFVWMLPLFNQVWVSIWITAGLIIYLF
ncbi:hypothetical protein [Liquorilactobacillus aquaticus]|uniref:hypothetical protein n=1 Tax=Liquorilactobacillus aquaticus TaxID=392566 RepID=UPI0007099EBC|nr:hypothetical protein [Liquorilactobacillus aquaticus]